MVYKFRIIFDSDQEKEVFRDIEILNNQNFEQFNDAIIKAFGFDGSEMSTFFISNDNWEQGEEIMRLDMGIPNAYTMKDTLIEDLVEDIHDKFIFVYDLLEYWTFLVELVDIQSVATTQNLPRTITALGEVELSVTKKTFSTASAGNFDDLEDKLEDKLEDVNFEDIEDIDNLDL